MNNDHLEQASALVITSKDLHFSLSQYDTTLPVADPISETQPLFISTLQHWLQQKHLNSLLLVAPPEAQLKHWLEATLLKNGSSINNENIEYLVLWQQALPLASYLQAPFAIVPLETTQAKQILHRLRSFSQDLLYTLQTITQDTYLLHQEEEFTKELLHLEQQLLSPIKSLAKNFHLYIVEEENLRFKSFPRFQVMHQDNLYNMEEIDHLYYQKELSSDLWQSIQQHHQAITGQWQKAITLIRQKELLQEAAFHTLSRNYIIEHITKRFDDLLEAIEHPAILSFLQDAKHALLQTMQYTPAPHHITILEALPMPIHLSLIQSQPCSHLWLYYDEVHDLWGSYDLKEHQPQIELGKLLLHPDSIIILQLADLLRQPDRWMAFKELLTTKQIPLLPEQNSNRSFTFPLTHRFILLASPMLYESAIYQEGDLERLFPLFALWQSEVIYNANILASYHLWLEKVLCEHFQKTTIDPIIITTLIHYLIAYSENRSTITTHFSVLTSILHYFDLHQLPLNLTNLQEAIAWPRQQKSQIWQQMLQEIALGTIHIPTQGKAVGKVVALVVVDVAQEGYGLPTLLSATATAGKDGLINIEREAGLSGEIHDKGAFIAEAFIRHTLGRYNSLSITATLAFEQTYDGVEGDSATAAEVCAILSAIGNIPLHQGIGITGSMNQHGELQAIGGISHKIEGFFTLCLQRGLTGTQGVILPQQNLQHLFLSPSIIQAIQEQQFHLWPCSHIHQALTLLSEIEVTPANAKGHYKKYSFFHQVEEELKRFSS